MVSASKVVSDRQESEVTLTTAYTWAEVETDPAALWFPSLAHDLPHGSPHEGLWQMLREPEPQTLFSSVPGTFL